MHKTLIKHFIYIACFCLTACSNQSNVFEVTNEIDPTQFVGTWYEIVRLDHPFEHGLTHVTATYTLREDGGIHVINRGYNHQKEAWNKVEGDAFFTSPANKSGLRTGKLKGNFFGALNSSYHILALDKPYYNYVMLTGEDLKSFWILARTPQLTYPIKQELISQAKALGFDTAKLIHVKQSHEIILYEAGPHMNE